MADVLTVSAALLVLFGFTFLFWFIRRLGLLEIETAMMPAYFQSPKPQPQSMVEVKNPFKMTVTSSSSLGWVEMIVSCMHPCNITCYWKIKRQYLHQMVYQSNSSEVENDAAEEQSVKNLHIKFEENCETVIGKDFTGICSGKKLSYNVGEFMNTRSTEANVTSHDIQLYDLVVNMELTEEHKETIESPSSITAMLTGIKLKIQNEKTNPCLVEQFIQTNNGKLFKLKKLFLEEPTNHEDSLNAQDQSSNLCIVCQMLPISRALIPCGHACLCSLCYDKVNTCPMCRQPMTSSFVLGEEQNLNQNNEYEFSDILKRMNPLEIIKGIYRAS